ncbi:MAG TPA: zf-HC2 domain-containing protein [Acidobacteriaceae bacterium]|nr:zf-HC2 domain-containing protein [Acidobacteriaceae bacterium]
MSDHLSPSQLNALADGELPAEQLAAVNEHLSVCPSCTSSALHQSLLKSATAKAGQRYTPPLQLQERMARLVTAGAGELQKKAANPSPSRWRFASLGWATAALLALVFAATTMLQRHRMALQEQAAMATEVFDQHIATLAGSQPPEVVSSDRHTVKPWFQGKIPFSFNLPENLPQGMTLDGANLTYLDNQPVAQLLYSIGKHRVSVFVRRKQDGSGRTASGGLRAGFQVIPFRTRDLAMVAVSDVDPARLGELVSAIQKAQGP